MGQWSFGSWKPYVGWEVRAFRSRIERLRVLVKLEAELSECEWFLLQLPDSGRLLIINNLLTSSLWHRFIILVPPPGLVDEVQQFRVNFFWSGVDPVSPCGRGRASRTITLRLGHCAIDTSTFTLFCNRTMCNIITHWNGQCAITPAVFDTAAL